MAALDTRHLTILLTDIKGFTDKTSSQTRAAIQAMLDEHKAIVLPILQNGGGQLVKTIGDAFLMTFASPTNAVLTGIAVQEALAKRNEGRAADDRLEIRIAINAGEVNVADNDVFGEAVNITARIEGIAEANQVYFTEAVYLAMNKNEVPSSEVGLMQLKGIPEKIRVYKVRREEPVGTASAAAGAAAQERHGFARFLPQPPQSPAAFGPGVKAIPASSTAVPKTWRRAVAFAIDVTICSLVLGMFVGSRHHGRRIHLIKTPAAPAAVNGLKVDDKGIHGDAGDVKVSIDENGIQVTPNKPADAKAQTTVYQNDKGVKVSVDRDEDASDSDDEDGSLARRFMSGKWDFAIIWVIYNLVFLKWVSGSPGKMIMKLRVVGQNGEPLEKNQRFRRAAFSAISLNVLFLGYLWALWEPQRRTWHDLVAGTRVVPVE